MKVLKFGGTSMGTAESMKKVIRIIIDSKGVEQQIGIVVSALSGVTDKLLLLSETLISENVDHREIIKDLKERHISLLMNLLRKKDEQTTTGIIKLFGELEIIMERSISNEKMSRKISDLILSFGERLSAYILTQSLKELRQEVFLVDAREYIITNNDFSSAKVDFARTNKNIQRLFEKNIGIAVITGFIGSTIDGETTTLGRGGSDYTASIFAAAIQADQIELWKEVDGIMTMDPKKNPKAFSITSLSFEEAETLSRFGAKVIYPPTIQPAIEKNIPIIIKNTFNPSFPGTIISVKDPKKGSIKCITSVDDATTIGHIKGGANNMSLITMVGSGIHKSRNILDQINKVLSEKNIHHTSLLNKVSQNCFISILVQKTHLLLTINTLHNSFFE
ncbi:aspartate kinase [Candidatus Gracilibacteria bacterium]|nr:aspartate kinase [Candidatus Gracilibacteria bacterium]